MPEGLLYRGKYAGGTRNINPIKTQEGETDSKMAKSMVNISNTINVNNRRLSERGYHINNPVG